MALAAFSHHSALRRQTKARAGEEGHEEHDASRRQKPPPPQPELFSLEEEPGGSLPAPLSEVAGRQDKVVRHVLEDLGSVCPVVQILDLPVPHMMDQLAELLNLEEDVLDASWWKYRRSCHFPRFSGLWSRPWTFQFRRVVGDTQIFKVFSEDRVQQVPSRSLTFPVEVFIAQVRVHLLLMNLVKGFFALFPKIKKSAKLGSHSGSELLRKKRTPRTSSLPGRARRRQRQWSACYAGFTGYNTPRVMFPSVDARPKMLCIMAGMHQEDSYAVFAGDDAPRAVPSRFHRCSSWTIYWSVVCNDRFSGPGAVLGQVLTCPLLSLTGEVGPDSAKTRGIAAVAVLRRWLTSLLHAATSSCSSRAENSRYAQCKLCTFRGDPPGAALGQGCRARCVQRQALVFQIVQKTCGGPAGAAHHHGHPHPRRGAEFVPHGSDFSADRGDSTVAVPRQDDMPVGVPHRCSGPDFLDKVVDMPVVVPGRCSGPDVQNHFVNKEVDMPAVVPHRCPGPASQKTVEVPLLQFFDKDSDMPVVVQRTGAGLDVQTTALLPQLLSGGASSTGAVVERTVVLPQLHLLRNSSRAALS